ncbi:MAG TPA: hypothetical protein VHC19_06955 [Pirellulales bacterium]|nr:hypothetical protein [Pirellulales bacterium]
MCRLLKLRVTPRCESALQRSSAWRPCSGAGYGIRRLEYLHLQAPNITGDGLRRLNANLVKLGLSSGAPLADADIVHLTRLKKLEWVYVSQPTTLTDAGLKLFEQMPQLKTLHLRAARATPQGIQRLKQALPSCRITITR